MKVLHVYKHAEPDSIGGVEAVISVLSKYQALAGHEVDVWATSKCGRLGCSTYKGVKVRYFKTSFTLGSTPFSWELFSTFRQRRGNFDIIHYHFPYPFADVCHLLAPSQNRSIVTYHSDILRQKFLKIFYHPIMVLFLRSVDQIIATSPNYFATSGTLEKHKNKIKVIPLGIDDPLDAAFDAQASSDLGQFFLFVGEFRYYKALDILVRAAKLVNANVVIVGSGKLEAKLKKLARDIGVQNVHFFGRITASEKQKLYQQCKAVVFPSNMRSEAFGITLLEASAFGKPMISCEIGTGTSFVNVHEQTGIVIPPNNVTALAMAMSELLRDELKCQRFGAAARKRYIELFQASAMATTYDKVYTCDKCC